MQVDRKISTITKYIFMIHNLVMVLLFSELSNDENTNSTPGDKQKILEVDLLFFFIISFSINGRWK